MVDGTTFIISNPTMEYTTMVPSVLNNGATHNLSDMVFSWYDYILFSLMLLSSVIIGIYFGCFGTKQSTTTEYLMGGKEMKVIPIVISLVASHTSGISLLAIPSDVYKFGASYWLGVISMLIVAVITVYVFLPVFFNLGITSTYEYLERRFDSKSRKCASALFTLSLVVYLPIVTYIPALAFSAASGVDVHYITPVVCGICIFYTTIGGLKAVVWTDTLQFSITSAALMAVFFLGIKSTGGFMAVWNKSLEGQRLDVFDFSLDPTKRETFWTIVVGLTVHWVAHVSINQGCTQKFMAVPTLRQSKLAVVFYCLGMDVMKSVCVLTGLIIFAKYSDCDPFITKRVSRKDQLLPYYVLDVASSIPGLSGLFIAGIFSAALSTLSANLNCLAATIYEDFIVGFLEKKGSQKSAGTILKLIVITTGVISTLMVYVIENLGGLFALSIGLGSVAHGPLLGMFVLGVLFPKANAKGSFWGAMSGLAVMSTVITGANYYKYIKVLKYASKPVSTAGCSPALNATLTASFSTLETAGPIWQPFFLFRLSFYWYTMMGATIVIVVGLLISSMTNNGDEPPVCRSLLSPVIHFLLPEEDVEAPLENGKKYYSIEKAMEIVHVEKQGVEKTDAP